MYRFNIERAKRQDEKREKKDTSGTVERIIIKKARGRRIIKRHYR